MSNKGSNEQQSQLFLRYSPLGFAAGFVMVLITQFTGLSDKYSFWPLLCISLLIGVAGGLLVGVIIRLWRRFRAKAD